MLTLLLVVLLVALAAAENTLEERIANHERLTVAIKDRDLLRKEFEDFKVKYGKVYGPSEEKKRFENFELNAINAVMSNNKNSVDKPLGITEFSDMSKEEFAQKYLMVVHHDEEFPGEVAEVDTNVELPTSFDWRNQTPSVVTPIKNQGQCGSCWDFSATETLESVCALAGYPLTKLSEQQTLDCDKTSYGCAGGWPYSAYEYMMQAGGVEKESDYPYTAQDGQCTMKSSDFVECKVDTWKKVTTTNSESEMESYLVANSPLSICADASQWMTYTGGVFMGSQCGDQIDHCIQATGYSVMSGTKVWHVRNSWGTSWGASGMIYIQYGVDACALAQAVTVPCVKDKSGKVVC